MHSGASVCGRIVWEPNICGLTVQSRYTLLKYLQPQARKRATKYPGSDIKGKKKNDGNPEVEFQMFHLLDRAA
jgi:hypothetical protein